MQTYLRKFARLTIAVAAVSILTADGSNAREFRKCNYMMMVKGSGLPDTEVEGVRFWSWSRQESAKGAWVSVGARAKICSSELVKRDYDTLPTQCNPNVNALNGRSIYFGITGLNTTRVRTRLKKTICEHHQRSNSQVRTIHDTRKIDGFAVYVRHVGSTTGACRSQPIISPSYLTIHCRKAGGDRRLEWSYTKN